MKGKITRIEVGRAGDPDYRRRWRIKNIELEVLKRGMIV